MKTLTLELTKNGKTEINKTINYFINEDKINFKDEESLYKINLEDKLFMKKDNDYLIRVDIKKEICTIKLLKENINFDIDIIKSKWVNKKNYLIIEYTLDDGENINNCINIKY